MYDDEDEYDDNEFDAERARVGEAEVAHGIEERTFYDDLAKKEDERHNAMRGDIKKHSLILAELEEKLRHKKTALQLLETRITQERSTIEYEAKKKVYRTNEETSDGDEASARAIPILSRDIGMKDDDNGFSVVRALANMRQLEEEKRMLEETIATMSMAVSDEARTLSQLQHTLLRA